MGGFFFPEGEGTSVSFKIESAIPNIQRRNFPKTVSVALPFSIFTFGQQVAGKSADFVAVLGAGD